MGQMTLLPQAISRHTAHSNSRTWW